MHEAVWNDNIIEYVFVNENKIGLGDINDGKKWLKYFHIENLTILDAVVDVHHMNNHQNV